MLQFGVPAGLAQVLDRRVQVLGGDADVAQGVVLMHGLLGLAGRRHVPVGITGGQQPPQLGPPLVIEAFDVLGQQPPGPVPRVVFAATMAQHTVLHPAAVLSRVPTLIAHPRKRHTVRPPRTTPTCPAQSRCTRLADPAGPDSGQCRSDGLAR